MSNNKPSAHLALNNNRVKSYAGKYYLNKGTEFQIELDNSTSKRVLVKLKINGVEDKSGLILNPGQRWFLDRFIDEDKKLLFDTYEVPEENFEAADKFNGDIEVLFYEEKEPERYRPPTTFGGTPYPWRDNTWTLGNSSGTFSTDASYTLTSSVNVNQVSVDPGDRLRSASRSKSVETGRVEKGEQSEQSFSAGYGDFNSYTVARDRIKILPMSHKPSEITPRKYCSECGAKTQKKFKYCAHCGEKL